MEVVSDGIKTETKQNAERIRYLRFERKELSLCPRAYRKKELEDTGSKSLFLI
jgi:hypothetical protein